MLNIRTGKIKTAYTGESATGQSITIDYFQGSDVGTYTVTVELAGCFVVVVEINVQADPTCTTIQPVYFTAEANNASEVSLSWQTITESNNSHIEIERSTNGISWLTINRIDGAGDSSTPITYSALDSGAANGLNYYRLKQIDFDQSYSYSNVMVVDREGNGITRLEFNPIPKGQNAVIVNTDVDINEVQLIDINGRLITSLGQVQRNSQCEIKLPNLSSGIYLLRCITQDDSHVLKLIVQ